MVSTGAGTGGAIDDRSAPERVGPSSRREWLVVFAILAAALLLRVAVVLVIQSDYTPLTDASDYDRIASSLAAGDGYGATSVPGAEGPSAFRAPMYPALLAAVYAVFGGHSWTWGLLENAVIGTALVAMIGVVGAQLFGRRVGLIALAIAAVHPTLALFGTSLQIEPLLALLEMATIAAAVQHRRRPRGMRYALASGVLLGLTVLTREIGIWLIPTVVLLVWSERPRWSRRALLVPAAALAAAIVVVSPWTVRNALRFSALVPVTTTSGVGLAGVYNETSRQNTKDPGLWMGPWFDPGVAKIILADVHRDEAEQDRVLRAAAVDFAREHPGYVMEVAVWNTVRLFDLNGPGAAMFIRQFIPYPSGLTRASVYASYLIYALAAFGATRALRRRAPNALWLFPLLVWMNLAVLSGNIRYRASIEPFLVLLAAVGVASWHAARQGAAEVRAE